MKYLLLALASFFLAGVVALAGSRGGLMTGSWPILTIVFLITFLIQWIMYVPSYLWQTEKFFDLTGSLTYIIVIVLSLLLIDATSIRTILMATMITFWSVRLGSFLFLRVMKDGEDKRFKQIKTSGARFFMTWSLQGLWVFLTAACALTAITSGKTIAMGFWGYLGTLLWVLGFLIEVIADRQKQQFRIDENNQNKFITSGLWSISRHPNYFGEVLLWTGIACMALPTLSGLQWVTLISPVFVYLLIRYVSGVPMLEESAERKWGDIEAYQMYKAKTPIFFPYFIRVKP